MKAAPPNDKYFLRSLHQEIDLLDRKLAHLDKYVDFANLADRRRRRASYCKGGPH